MTDEDYLRCHHIHAQATMSSYGQVYPWLEPIVSDVSRPLESVEWTIVCDLEGDVVGYAAVSGRHLENLFVAPKVQGRGVGAALLSAVQEQTGLPLTLRCLLVNDRARRFYERHGFAVSHQEEIDFFGRQLSAWLMQKHVVRPA